MTVEVVIIFLAIVFVWAVVGPIKNPVPPPAKHYEEGEGGPPGQVNHRPKRKPPPEAVPEGEKTLTTDTYSRMMSKEKSNVRFE